MATGLEEAKLKILIASKIDEAAVRALRRSHEIVEAWGPGTDLLPLMDDCDVLVFRSGVAIDASLLAAAPRLALIVRAGSGTDNIDLDLVRDRGIRFERIPGPGARAVAELTFALILALSRQLFFADGEWRRGNWVKNEVEGYLLAGKTLGIVGVGNIGGLTGEMGVSWGMDVIGCVSNPSEDRVKTLAAMGIRLLDLAAVLAQADYLSLHVPLNETTRNMIAAKELASMKRGSFLINLARGGVVDEAALCDALAEGHLRGAGLDVHAEEGQGRISPLAGFPNTILTPHIGASTLDSQRQIGEHVLEIVGRFAR